ncbi:MAG: hypothetical protein HDS62_02005 [Bacteroidales bacterium]|nr:hypothetical protein [Bacteroidales bacterium]
MHSIIFQVSINPIHREDFINPDRINEGEMVYIDYASELNETERKHHIKGMVENLLPKGMFALNPDGESVTYKGGYTEWSMEYAKGIQERANVINPCNLMKATGPVWQLQKYILNPLATDCLFVSAFYGGEGTAERSRSLMKIVSEMTIGQILYFGAVLDYHF